MLVRDKLIENKEFEDKKIEKSVNNSELLSAKKRTLHEKIDSIIENTVSKNEQRILSDSADIIEILMSNLRRQGISEEKLVYIIEQKTKMFGSYNDGYIKK